MRSARRSRWPRRRRARRGASGLLVPGGLRSCGWRSRRQRSPGESLSGFIPRHIEQPASRHSKPAARKILSRPSASACVFTRCDPGTTSARSPDCTLWPASTLPRQPKVLDPRVRARADEDGVDRDVGDRGAGGEVHVAKRPLGGFSLAGVAIARRVGDHDRRSGSPGRGSCPR